MGKSKRRARYSSAMNRPSEPAALPVLDDAAMLRYSRHLLLSDWGFEAQQALAGKTALLVGAGGLGCAAAQALAAAGVGQLIIADDDQVELSNLQRQILHDMASVGQPKVDSAQQRLHAVNPEVRIDKRATRLLGAALDAAVAQADVVLDCSDNLSTRLAINAACVRLAKPLISGAALGWRGQLFVYLPPPAQAACYHCLYPQSGADATQTPDEPCATMGVFTPLVMTVGSLQASEALKLLAGLPLDAGVLTLLDLQHSQQHKVQVPRAPHCSVCGEGSKAGL